MAVLDSNTISSKHLIDNFNEGIIVLDSSYKILFASNVFLSLSGFELSDLAEKSIDVIFPKNADALKFILQNDETKLGDKLFTEICSKDKKNIPVSFPSRILRDFDNRSMATALRKISFLTRWYRLPSLINTKY